MVAEQQDAPIGAEVVKVVGTAATADEGGKPVTLVREAVAVEEIYLPGGGRGRFDAGMQAVAVTTPSDLLRVKVNKNRVVLKPGEEVKIDVELVRRADYDKGVTLDVLLRHLGGVHGNPLPPGVTMVDGKSKTALRAGSNQGQIVLKAAATAAPIENVPICVLAHVSINFVVKVSYASPPIPLTIQK